MTSFAYTLGTRCTRTASARDAVGRSRASGRSTRSARGHGGNTKREGRACRVRWGNGRRRGAAATSTKREGRACRVRWGDGRRRGAAATSASLPPFRSRRIMGGPCRASSPALVLPLWRSPPRCRGGSALRGLSARAAVPAAPHFRRVPRPLQGSFCPPGTSPCRKHCASLNCASASPSSKAAWNKSSNALRTFTASPPVPLR